MTAWTGGSHLRTPPAFAGAAIVVLGQGGGADGDVGTGVEQFGISKAVARSPVERNAEQADGGATATAYLVDEPEGVGGGAQLVVHGECREVSDEQRRVTALDVDKRPHERVVGMEAARQDDR
jgi:hypothetical protein